MIEFLLFIFCVTVLILIIQLKNNFNEQMKLLTEKVNLLLAQKETRVAPELKHEPKPEIKSEIKPKPEPAPIVPPGPVEPIQRPIPAPPAPKPKEKEIIPKPKKPSFSERYPDLEKFIGENLFNKIGIGVLVIGIGFFLKYAIDKNWINETGRTFIGILCGGILIGLAHRMRKAFAPFSSVLVGGGVAVLYYTFTIAYQQYHLIGQTLAFIMMVLITAFTVILSLSYDRRELAVLATLGGFTSPLLVSTGGGHVTVLFSYILILNVGMLVLAYYKKWNLVNIIAYIATVLLFGSWLASRMQDTSKPFPYVTALVFATLFYIIFFLMNVINNIRQKVKFNAGEIILLLSNTFLYYTAGMFILHDLKGGMFQGLFTAFIAVFNFIFAYSLYRNQRADRTLIYLLIGLVLSFLSLTAPIQLKGNYITLFWATESVLLLWLSQRSGIALMRYAAMIVFVLMGFSLIMDWSKLYLYRLHNMPPVFNSGFITSVVCTAAVYMHYRLQKDDTLLPSAILKRGFAFLFVLAVYVSILLELYYQCNEYCAPASGLISGVFSYLSLAVVLYLARKETITVKYILLALAFIAAMSYVVTYNDQAIFLRNLYLKGDMTVGYFLSQYPLVIMLFVVLYQTYRLIRTLELPPLVHVFQWAVTVGVLYILSAQLDHVVALSAYRPGTEIADIVENNQKTGYAILWGAFAFTLMYLGLKWSSRQVRIISISVFGLTLLKLFIFDLRGLSEGGKIAAFISLGVLLLIISFMYQRLKKIILDDKQVSE